MRKVLTFVLVVAPAFAFAADLKPAQEEAKAKFDEAVADPLKTMNDKCGTKVTVKSDYENYKETDWSGYGHYGWCQPVFDTLGEMCAARPAYKKVISKKLTGVSCLFGGGKPAEKKDDTNAFTQRNMSFDKGTFTFHMSKDDVNVGDNVKATMEKALN